MASSRSSEAVEDSNISSDDVEDSNISSDAVEDSNISSKAVEDSNISSEAVENSNISSSGPVDESNISSDAAEDSNISSSDAVEDINISSNAVEDPVDSNISSNAVEDPVDSNISSNAVEDAVDSNISSNVVEDAIDSNISSEAVEESNISSDTVEDDERNLTTRNIGRTISLPTEENYITINEDVALPFHLAADHHDIMIMYYHKSDIECIRAENLKKFLIAKCKPDTKVLLMDDPYFAEVTDTIEGMKMAQDRCTLFFLLLSPEFCKDKFYGLMRDAYLIKSLNDPDKQGSVIPLRTKKLEYKTPIPLDALGGIDIEDDLIGNDWDITDEKLNVDIIQPKWRFEKKVRDHIERKKYMRKQRQEQLEKERKKYKEEILLERTKKALKEKEAWQKHKEQQIQETEANANKKRELNGNEEDDQPWISINVTKVDPDFLEGKLYDPNVYPVKHKSRGRAVIINNQNFHDMKDRAGSDFDVCNLADLLTELGFLPKIHIDKTAQEMVDIIAEESRHKDHAEADSFILAVLSHGAQGVVYGTDGKKGSSKKVSIEETIKKAFDDIHCPALAGKPKLIIIQACQNKSKANADSESRETEEEDPDLSLLSALKRLHISDEDQLDAVPLGDIAGNRAHEKGDMCVAYSTVAGYLSHRSAETGSWFIRKLVDVFMRDAHTKHVSDLLRIVRREVYNLRQRGDKGWCLQMTKSDETLMKNWYLFPGYTPHQK